MKRRFGHCICRKYIWFDVRMEGLGRDKQTVFARLHKIRQFSTCWNYQLEDTLHNLDCNLYTFLAGIYLLSSEVRWNIINSASWEWQAETMSTSVQINNPISRSEVIVTFSLLFFFSVPVFWNAVQSRVICALCQRKTNRHRPCVLWAWF